MANTVYLAICTHFVVPYTGANNDLIFNLWCISQAHFLMPTFQLRIGGFGNAGVWFYRRLCCTLYASHIHRLNLSFAFTTVFTYNFNGMWFLSAHRRTRNVKCHFMCTPHARAHFKLSQLRNTQYSSVHKRLRLTLFTSSSYLIFFRSLLDHY